MHDLNFFSYFKKAKTKDKTIGLVLTVVILVILLLNGGLIGGGLWLMNQVQGRIDAQKSFISNPDTKTAIQEAQIVSKQASLTSDYLKNLQTLSSQIASAGQVDAPLLDQIRQLTPQSVNIQLAQLAGRHVSLACISTDPEAAMDMIHAFKTSPRFSQAFMGGISINDGLAIFSINAELADQGGEQP